MVAQRLPIPPDELDYFLGDISKDRHAYGLGRHLGEDVFVKRSATAGAARREHEAFQLLYASAGERLVPRPRGLEGAVLYLDVVDGIRLFDLLRLLRRIAGEPADPRLAARALEACGILLGRCTARLERIQTLLTGASVLDPPTPYPFDRKVRQLLSHLSRLLGLAPLSPALHRELDNLGRDWDRSVSLPFRDATPKNIIIADPGLAVRCSAAVGERLSRIRERLANPDLSWFRRVDILDIDLASIEHLTTPEDDFISLLAHEISHDLPVTPPAGVAGLQARLARAPERAALALFVRYLRFGGRKASYRLISPTGFATRFRYDDAAFYFAALPAALAAIDPGFGRRNPAVLERCRAIGRALSELGFDDPAAQASTVDAQVRYWQESPLELSGAL
jgi:hypothetical protein